MIKWIVFEKLEEYEKEKANGTLKTCPIDDLWKELDL